MSKNTNLSFLTDYITADITNSRIGINNASPTVAFDVSGATKISGALTLTSTISNGTYTYTLPSATGTLALTSALSGYLPLSGGTLTGALSGTTATFKVSENRNLAIKFDTNITLSGQNDSGAPENLRIYADTFKIFTSTTTVGLTERLTISNTGNVGIGTSTPTNSTLEVRANADNISWGSVATLYGYLTWGTSGSFGENVAIIKTPASTGIVFQPAGSEKMRITSGGNVLIGTSTDSGYKLEVAGTMYVTNTFGANSKFSSYSTDGLFGANARPCTITTPGGGQTIRFGYNDYGAGQYWGRMGFAATTNWSLGTIDAAGNNFSIGTDFRGTQLYIYTNGNYAFSGSNVSDSRKKANINYITSNQLENILKLKPASFNQKGSDGIINGNTHTGFIAQDVLDAGIDNLVHGSDEDGYGLDYYGVLSLAVKAIQEQQAQIEELKTLLKTK